MRGEGAWTKGAVGDGEKPLDSKCISKMTPTGLDVTGEEEGRDWNMNGEEEGRNKDDF